ncbi:MAG: hypothetical protein CEN87_467 [Parcubacteria group bacterium Licking1014_1]|nr:MAG: hypothetical protein CEN87_467 [Parcubacteria group bacterium Licking1014_1]
MNKLLQTFGKIAFIILLLVFAIAFFLYKQYWIAFFTLALILVVSSWGRVKKLIIGKDKVEVQIPEDLIKREDKENK